MLFRLIREWWHARFGGLNLDKLRESIHDIEPANERLRQGADAIVKVSSEKAAKAKKLDRLNLEEIESSNLELNQHAEWLLAVLLPVALIAVLTDIPAQAAVTSISFILTPVVLWTVAICLSIGVTTVTKGASLAMFNDPVRPRKVVRRALFWAGAFGIVSVASFSVILAARSAQGAMVAMLIDWVPAATWILAETAPIVAGLLLAACEILSIPRIRSLRIKDIEAEIRAIETLETWLKEDAKRCMEKLTPAPKRTLNMAPNYVETPNPTPRPNGQAHDVHLDPPSSAAPIALLLAVALLGSACTGNTVGAATVAKETPSGTPVSAVVPSTSVTADERRDCFLAFDATSSVNVDLRAEANSRVSSTIEALVDRLSCGRLVILTFADEAQFAPRVFSQSVPAQPAIASCAPPDDLRALGAFRGAPEFVKESQRRHDVACAETLRPVIAKYKTDRETFVAEARNTLHALAEIPPRGECTSLLELVTRLLGQEPATGIFLTDLATTCGAAIEATPLSLAPASRAVFIVIPSSGALHQTAPVSAELETRWKHLLPDAQFVLANDIDDSTWQRIAARNQ